MEQKSQTLTCYIPFYVYVNLTGEMGLDRQNKNFKDVPYFSGSLRQIFLSISWHFIDKTVEPLI